MNTGRSADDFAAVAVHRALAVRVDAVRAYDKRVRPSLPELHPSEVLDDVIYLLDGGDLDALHWGGGGDE